MVYPQFVYPLREGGGIQIVDMPYICYIIYPHGDRRFAHGGHPHYLPLNLR